MNKPDVTILVPVYGVERYIAECAESLFAQTYPEIEYVFIDDCTPDNSIQVLQSVVDRYPDRKSHVRIVRHQHNTGIGGVRRTALTHVRTDCFIMVDSDDVLPTDAVEILVGAMQTTGSDIVDGAYQEYKGGACGSPVLPPYDTGASYVKKVMCQNVVSNRLWGRLYKSHIISLLPDMFIEGIDYAEDYCANARLAVLTTRSWTDRVVYRYRTDNQQSYTKQMSEKNLVSYLRSNARVLSFYHRRGHLPMQIELAMLNAYRVARGRQSFVDEHQQYVPQHLRARVLYKLFHSSVPYAATNFLYKAVRTISLLLGRALLIIPHSARQFRCRINSFPHSARQFRCQVNSFPHSARQFRCRINSFPHSARQFHCRVNTSIISGTIKRPYLPKPCFHSATKGKKEGNLIFHIISRLDVGGAERVAINIAAAQDTANEHHIVELIRGRSSFTDAILAELRQRGVRCHRSPLPVFIHWHYVVERIIAILFPLRLLWLWLRYRPDIIHSHTEMPDMAVWLSVKCFPFIKCKVVRTIHNTTLWQGMEFVGPRVERFMQQHNANVAISPNVQAAYHKAYGQLPPIIYNGMEATPQRRYDGLADGKVNICFAGRFEEQKGIDVLCQIVRALSTDQRYHFHIFGSGRQQSLIDKQLHGLHNVSVSEPLQGIAAYMSSFDYLIMPSRHEGLSLLAIEACLNKLPLLVNRCAGLIDVLPPDWQFAVSDNELGEWLHLFRDILPSADRNAAIASAYRYAISRFSLQQMQEEYSKLYHTITQ